MNLTLVNRLRGIYTVPVNDGDGLLEEAAKRIEELEAACAAAMHAVAHYDFNGDILWVSPPWWAALIVIAATLLVSGIVAVRASRKATP